MTIEDAERWTAERTPDPTPEQLRHQAAGKVYAKACEALEAWTGPRDRKNPEYASVLDTYHAAKAEHDAAGRALPRE